MKRCRTRPSSLEKGTGL